MRRFPNACLLGLSALLLSACAKDQSEFPSLARRPAERLNTPAPDPAPTPVATPIPPDPAFLARIDGLVARARSADARFQARTGQTRAAVAAAAGAAVASENWSVATIALSELETARSETMIALAEVDEIHARAEVEGTDSPELVKARETLVALVAGQDEVLAELGGRLRN